MDLFLTRGVELRECIYRESKEIGPSQEIDMVPFVPLSCYAYSSLLVFPNLSYPFQGNVPHLPDPCINTGMALSVQQYGCSDSVYLTRKQILMWGIFLM